MVSALVAALVLAAEPAQPKTWNCATIYEPGEILPSGNFNEPVVIDAASPNARDEAASLARERILANHCGNTPCPELRAKVWFWKWGEGGGKACALAMLPVPDFDAWRKKLSAKDVSKQLDDVIDRLLADLPPGQPAKIAVSINKIEDDGLAGGKRAEWLQQLMEEALSRRANLSVVAFPEKVEKPGALPKGVNALLHGVIFTRQDDQTDMLEIGWSARRQVKNAVDVKTARLVVPLAVAPRVEQKPAKPLPETDPRLSIRIDAGGSGSLCPGEMTDLHLYSEEDRYIQVYSVYGKDLDKALLVYPTADFKNNKLQGGRAVSLGELTAGESSAAHTYCGFQALPTEGGSGERFVVLAAKKPEDFGPLKAIAPCPDGGVGCGCRLKDAAVLFDPKALPKGVWRGGDGYRVGDSRRCTGRKPTEWERTCADHLVPVDQIGAVEEAIARLPVCK